MNFKKYNWKNERFLIADDDVHSHMLLEKILMKTGAETIIARDGEEACKLIETDSRITFAILDLIMPVLTGFEVIKKTKKIRPDIIYIAYTADVVRMNSKKCLSCGFERFIAKPILPDRLLMEINGIIIERQR